MKAAVLEELNRFAVKDVLTPEIDDNSALMRVERVCICGSDVRIFRHGNPRVETPCIIGHEAAGVITQVGKNVKRVKKGDRVSLGADVPCGECSWCRNGLGNNCAINYAMGYQFPGSFAEFVRLDRIVLEEGPVTPFGESLSFDEASLAEPLACAINGFELVNMSFGKTVVIIGMGPIGCMMIDLARIMGASKVICVQRSQGLRLEIAKCYKADVYIVASEENVIERCRQETDGEGPDIVITACGSVESHEQAVEMVRHRGWVNLFGGLAKNARPMSLLSNVIHYKECFLTGSHGCVPRHHEMAVDLLQRKQVHVNRLLTHRYSLDLIAEAFEAMESRKGMKVVIEPHAPCTMRVIPKEA
jgi:L-iditol 2-dehydrogenase